MRLFLISNNQDTAVGLRLAGVEGVIVNSEQEAIKAFDNAVKDENIAIVLMNKSLFDLCDDTITAFRKSHTVPLIVEIPDKGDATVGGSLSKFLKEVGINI